MKALKKYLITLLVGFAGVALILWSKDIMAQTAAVDVFHILCDAFFVVGFVITAAGLLVFSSNEGTFDMLVYGVKSFLDMFRKDSIKKYDTFYDYRESRAQSKMSFGFMIICGLFFLAVSMVMYYFYTQYK
jgi:drug/metabolite transporter (DMT)-like permease